ncbi:MAG: hypothetical protein AB7O45_08290 [Alphaproteobacteria bacterium]
MPAPQAEADRAIGIELRGGAVQCGTRPETFVRDQRGTGCADYEAEIAGWSDGCVKQCDTPARLAEAVAAARATCAAFCAARNCPPGLYDPPRQCAFSVCGASPTCPAECPQLNSCMLEQQVQRWNCKCIAP